MSNWSVTAVCSASQLDAEGLFFFSGERQETEHRSTGLLSPTTDLLERNFCVLLTQTGYGGWQVLFTPTDLRQWNKWCYYCQKSARGNNETDGLSSYCGAEEGAIHCLPACLPACLCADARLHAHPAPAVCPPVLLSVLESTNSKRNNFAMNTLCFHACLTVGRWCVQ